MQVVRSWRFLSKLGAPLVRFYTLFKGWLLLKPTSQVLCDPSLRPHATWGGATRSSRTEVCMLRVSGHAGVRSYWLFKLVP